MRKFLCLLLGLMPFFTACDDDDDFETPETQLTSEVQQDLKERFEGAEIKAVHNGERGTEVNLIDKDKNEVSIFYHDFNKLDLTVTKFASFKKLPSQVKYAFYSSPYGKMKTDRIDHIVCDDYAMLPVKMYKIDFTYFAPGTGELYTQLTFNEDGYLLPVNHGFTNSSWLNPVINSAEINFINRNYGIDIRSYENLGGTVSYYVMDHEVLKKVSFRNDKWQSTVYPLPLDTEVPTDILKQLYETEPGFKYVELKRVESPNGDGYWFVDDKGHGLII